MSLQTRPVYIPIDAVAGTLAAVAGTATTMAELKSNTKALSSLPDGTFRGAITNVGVKMSTVGGDVKINFYEDEAGTIPVCSVILTPLTLRTLPASSLIYAQGAPAGADGAPFNAGLWWEAVPDASTVNETFTLYVKVKGLR